MEPSPLFPVPFLLRNNRIYNIVFLEYFKWGNMGAPQENYTKASLSLSYFSFSSSRCTSSPTIPFRFLFAHYLLLLHLLFTYNQPLCLSFSRYFIGTSSFLLLYLWFRLNSADSSISSCLSNANSRFPPRTFLPLLIYDFFSFLPSNASLHLLSPSLKRLCISYRILLLHLFPSYLLLSFPLQPSRQVWGNYMTSSLYPGCLPRHAPDASLVRAERAFIFPSYAHICYSSRFLQVAMCARLFGLADDRLSRASEASHSWLGAHLPDTRKNTIRCRYSKSLVRYKNRYCG